MFITDGQFVTAADLQVVDGQINDVAKSENIVIDRSPQSIITRTLSELGNDFTSKIQNFSGYLVGLGVNMNHAAAVMNILSTAINRPRALLHQIPVIEPDPTRTSFKRWAEYYCLYAFYRNANHRKLNDRFAKKRDEYDKERKRSWEILKSNGFPVVLTPIPCPGATLEYGSGTWDAGNLSSDSGSSQDTGNTWDVAITWVAMPPYVSGNAQNNAESGPSFVVSLTTSTQTAGSGDTIEVDITSLNPPTSTIPTAIGTAPGIWSRTGVTHWNVYAGTSGTGVLYQQNTNPIPVATKTFDFTDAPVLSGFVCNAGQHSDYDFSLTDITWRA
jgi:hypothetical protein